MTLKFEPVAGPYNGVCGGLAWNGAAMIFAAVDEGRLLKYLPASGEVEEVRRYTNRTNGIAFGPLGELYGCQEGGRRVVQFLPDGSTSALAYRLDGQLHNQPNNLAIDSTGRLWFCDPHHPTPTPGVQIFPMLEHCSVLRLRREDRRIATRGTWEIERVTYDTASPRALVLSPDERTLYVADGNTSETARRELRAYPVRADGSLEQYRVLHTFGADYRGVHRGIEGMCLDADGNIVACSGWRRSGPGPVLQVISPQGVVLEAHELPGDMPMNCAFGDVRLDSLYVTTAEGFVYRARGVGRRGYQRR